MKKLLITNADSVIGFLIAEKLSTQDFQIFAGVHSLTNKDIIDKLNTLQHVSTIKLDVTNKTNISEAFKSINKQVEEFSGIIFAANVSENLNSNIITPILELREEDLLRILDVNLFGIIRLVQLFYPLLQKSHGKIISLSICSKNSDEAYLGTNNINQISLKFFHDTLQKEIENQGIESIFLNIKQEKEWFLTQPDVKFYANRPEYVDYINELEDLSHSLDKNIHINTAKEISEEMVKKIIKIFKHDKKEKKSEISNKIIGTLEGDKRKEIKKKSLFHLFRNKRG